MVVGVRVGVGVGVGVGLGGTVEGPIVLAAGMHWLKSAVVMSDIVETIR